MLQNLLMEEDFGLQRAHDESPTLLFAIDGCCRSGLMKAVSLSVSLSVHGQEHPIHDLQAMILLGLQSILVSLAAWHLRSRSSKNGNS